MITESGPKTGRFQICGERVTDLNEQLVAKRISREMSNELA